MYLTTMSRLRSFSQQAAARDKRILAAAIPHVKYMCAPINLQPALMPSTVYSLCLLFSLIFVLYIHFFVCVSPLPLCAAATTLLKRPWKHNRNSILSRLDILFVVCRHSYYFYFARTFIIVHRYAVRDIWANMGRAKYTHGFWRTEIR